MASRTQSRRQVLASPACAAGLEGDPRARRLSRTRSDRPRTHPAHWDAKTRTWHPQEGGHPPQEKKRCCEYRALMNTARLEIPRANKYRALINSAPIYSRLHEHSKARVLQGGSAPVRAVERDQGHRMAYIAMAYTVMAYIVIAYIIMAAVERDQGQQPVPARQRRSDEC